MNIKECVWVVLLAPMFCLSSAYGQSINTVGSDVYLTDSSPSLTTEAQRDAFVAGFSPTVTGKVVGDLHVAGFSATTNGPVGEDYYAAGSTVIVNSNISKDATIAAFSVTLSDQAQIGGNVRIAAGTATIDSPINGSLIARGGEVKINSTITGDVNLSAAAIAFGESARIEGNLIYASEKEVSIPSSVIAAERVQQVAFSRDDIIEDVKDTVDTAIPSFWPSLFSRILSFFIVIAFLVLLAALCLAFIPNTVDRLQQYVRQHTGKSVLAGFFGLSTLVGIVPVSLITIIGIPLIPVAILAILVFWILGYLLGAYVISRRLYASFAQPAETQLGRILVLAGGLIVLSLLNFIPFIGWLFNLAVVLVGMGAITWALTQRFFAYESTSTPA